MAGNPRGSGQRSSLYSDQRFTNWTPHDRYWAEVEALPHKMRPRVEVARGSEQSLGAFDRPLADGFVRPWSVEDVADVLHSIPDGYLSGLTGIYLLGGTMSQRSLKRLMRLVWRLSPHPTSRTTLGLSRSTASTKALVSGSKAPVAKNRRRSLTIRSLSPGCRERRWPTEERLT
jgi:hypothetical protein